MVPAFIALVSAHSSYLFGISLDFDKELKSGAIGAAQEFLNTSGEPLSFDLDKGLIMVHFEPEQRNYVEVNTIDYSVQGMRNENLKHKDEEKVLTKEQGSEIARAFFETLPNNVKSELKYNPEISEVDGTYFYKWFRHVNGVLIIDENFMVNVDAVNGNIIAWRLSIFDYPKESIGTVPAISRNVAAKVAELSFNAPPVKGFEPYLIIYARDPIWVNRLQGQFYPYFVGVSGVDGSIAFTGTVPGEVPKGYGTSQVEAVETDLIKAIYNKK
ncbi:hypothetical protein HYX08_06395 [Candidatus Woesearchaeota archaeon]|nr:hypothetical protein [Candidatus Woesearchaeota archaeon]